MKRPGIFWIELIVIILCHGYVFTQDTDIIRGEIEGRSIHQIEWESYQDKIPEKEQPVFNGQPMDLIPREASPSREVFGYLPYWAYNSYPNLNYNLLTTIAYFGVDINETGNITNYHNWPAAGLINQAHSQGVRVVLTVILFEGPQIATLLSSASNRTNLVNNLLVQVQNANADGVSIDFENVPGSQRLNLTTFMTELTTAFHNGVPGSFVTIFTPAVDWSSAFEYYNLAQVTDGLIMQGYDFHWRTSPTAGPVAPLTGGVTWGTYNVTWTVNDYLTKTAQNFSKLILSVPFYGFEWPTTNASLSAPTLGPGTTLFYTNAYSNALQYGRLWEPESQTPWYNYSIGNDWFQGWYDDSLSLALKFNLINQQDLKGAAIWALSYDGQRQELQAAISNAFGSTVPPLKPVNFRIVNLGNGVVEITVKPAAGATSYRLYRSLDGVTFDPGTDFPNATIILNSLSYDSTYYFKVSALNGNGESPVTEVLAVRPYLSQADILIVNGFDRVTGTVNTFDYVKRFAPSLDKLQRAFDSASNEAVIDDHIDLQDYDIVLWISGEEGTADESFSLAEQQRISSFLENGGNMFVSGSEIGYDLVEQGTMSDQLFYEQYLKADYILDAVSSYTISGVTQTIFSNLLNITFDDGNHGSYNVDYPDGFNPAGGSVQCFTYNGHPASLGGAGIQYEGIFGGGTVPGRLVYLGIGFETIYPESSRDSVMSRIMNFFGVVSGLISQTGERTPSVIHLAQNYPNPFNPSTTIFFSVENEEPLRITLTIYDILGQRINTLINEELGSGQYEIMWDGKNDRGISVPSGIYLYRLQAGTYRFSKKMYLLR
ncbi:MAG: T9SS type A sorting domain-containing protein [bacterium]|nr:MAG: T9SS type A sorting domain-containing protein [bacterium]